jgi:(5-formylfuran-3-yl)methyl phosphate synthase
MLNLNRNSDTPGLLVSVRSAAEALTALEAGADVIDVKEPNRGSLGAADFKTLAEIVQVVEGRSPVTAAMGELVDINAANSAAPQTKAIPSGVSLFKIGLAGCAELPNWQARWRDAVVALRGLAEGSAPQPVAVVYADWQAAHAPPPNDVSHAAVELHCPALLIDTWDKSAGGLFDHWPIDDLQAFLNRARSHDLIIVLAGSLLGESFNLAVQLAPHLVAVRTAACDAGRNGTISAARVRELKRTTAAIPASIVD